MPTKTPLPTGLPRAFEITITVESGDSLKSLADEYDSTVDDIMKVNKLTDANTIYVGEKLIIRINLQTKTPTLAPTSTPSNLVTPLPSPTATTKK
jgi:lysozyme